ncbi:hypothetical protein BDQ12DRAFT_670911 [Crucibulum laeve]|uniref:Uncharacterized protein n=1 Tax=Crucibulum laeve TaxID=68775 RepID=A0A5C3LK44_9AGAR|nr:hypothetical protein BDQ12DRAFT_670911 [Crucibulum laeve]
MCPYILSSPMGTSGVRSKEEELCLTKSITNILDDGRDGEVQKTAIEHCPLNWGVMGPAGPDSGAAGHESQIMSNLKISEWLESPKFDDLCNSNLPPSDAQRSILIEIQSQLKDKLGNNAVDGSDH